MTRKQHLDERTQPNLRCTGTATAVSYHFRSEHGWAICTVNDATGELSIQSDWGSWGYRWSANPAHLGAPNLTAFLRDRRSVDYLYDKLHYGRARGRFSPEFTIKALREFMIDRYADDYFVEDEHGNEKPVPREEVPKRIQEDPKLGEAWDALDEVEHYTDSREFFENLDRSVHEHITDSPWEHAVEEEDFSSTILREAILPALITALNAPAAEVTT